MTGSNPDSQDAETRPISVAELLARNGNIGSPPVTGRRRRRRGGSDSVTVAELTGEIPVIRDEDLDEKSPEPAQSDESASAPAAPTEPPAAPAAPAAPEVPARPPEPEPRWPRSMPDPQSHRGLEHSHYPRPARRSQQAPESRAERMSPDPIDDYDAGVGTLDQDTPKAEPAPEPPAEPPVTQPAAPKRSMMRRILFGKPPSGTEKAVTAAESTSTTSPAGVGEGPDTDLDDAGADQHPAESAESPAQKRSRWSELLSAGAIVLQSILAVVFGAGLYVAFDQLWRWNEIVALVLTVLVTLGLVAAVQAVRRTVDIASTLIAVAVGLLITLAPLALHAN